MEASGLVKVIPAAVRRVPRINVSVYLFCLHHVKRQHLEKAEVKKKTHLHVARRDVVTPVMNSPP
ncbi:hypothetical protein CDAR_291571, partial [Caerostris darwini]